MATMARQSWFPGHMFKAFKDMQERIKQVDLIVELRDARVPLSSINEQLERLVMHKPRLLVLSKADLCPPALVKRAASWLGSQGLHVLPSSMLAPNAVDKLLAIAIKQIQRERPSNDMSLMMVCGLPNTGKSSLINALKQSAHRRGLLGGTEAHGKAARTGPLPGVTRHMDSFKVSTQPLLYVLDTPGVLMPSMRDEETAVKLRLTGALPDGSLPDEAVLRQLLHMLATRPALRRQLAAHAAPLSRHSGHHGGARGSPQGRMPLQERRVHALLAAATAELHMEETRWHPGMEEPAANQGHISKIVSQAADLVAPGAADMPAASQPSNTHLNHSRSTSSSQALEAQRSTDSNMCGTSRPASGSFQAASGEVLDARMSLLLQAVRSGRAPALGPPAAGAVAQTAVERAAMCLGLVRAMRLGELGGLMLDEVPRL